MKYDFRATFTYTTNGGPVILMCPLSDGAIMWYTEFNKSAFESRGERVVEGTGPFITRDKEYTSLVKVREERKKIEGYLNDRLVCEFNRQDQALSSRFLQNWSLPAATAIGTGVWASDNTITKVDLVEVSRPGKQLR